jgi:hypothetical protein
VPLFITFLLDLARKEKRRRRNKDNADQQLKCLFHWMFFITEAFNMIWILGDRYGTETGFWITRSIINKICWCHKCCRIVVEKKIALVTSGHPNMEKTAEHDTKKTTKASAHYTDMKYTKKRLIVQ